MSASISSLKSCIRLVLLCSLLLVAACESQEDRFNGHMLRAEEQLTAGNLQLASVEIRNALRINDGSPEAHYLQARIAEEQQQFSTLLRHLERTVALDPEHLDAQIKLAWVYSLKGDLQAAEQAAVRARELAPEDPRTLVALANVRVRQQELPAAGELANAALVLDPASDDAFAVLAAIAREQDDFIAAGNVLREGIEQIPDSLTLSILLLEHSRKNESAEVTTQLLEQLVARFPEQLPFSRELSDIYLAQGDPAAAERVLRSAVAGNPASADAVLMLAESLAVTQPEEAIRILNAFLPDAGVEARLLQLRLADLHQFLGDTGQARALYVEIAENADDSLAVAAYRQLAKIALAADEPLQAQEALSLALAIDPADRNTLLDQASMQLRSGDASAALQTAQQLSSSHPESVEGALLLGTIYAERGSQVLAQSQYQKVLQLEPGNSEAALALAALHRSDGELKRSERILAAALSSNPADLRIAKELVAVKVAMGDWSGAQDLIAGPLLEETPAKLRFFIAGELQQSAGQLAQSTESFIAALSSDPEFAPAITGLLDNARGEGGAELTLAALEAFVHLNPECQRPYLALAGLYSERGNVAQAQRTVDELMQRYPEWLPGEQARTRVLFAAGDTEGATASAQRALRLSPDDVSSLLALASLDSNQGQLSDAIRLYRQILAIDAANIVARNNLASLLVRTSSDPADIAQAAELAESFRDARAAALLHTLGWIEVVRGRSVQGVTLLAKASAQLPDNAEILCHLSIGRALVEPESAQINELKALCSELSTQDVNVKRLLQTIALADAS